MSNKKLIFKNKRSFFDYEIIDKMEAGIVLQGTEVKSIRSGKVSLVGSFCYFHNNTELFIKDMDIGIYDEGSYNNHEPKRERKLLLHKNQLEKLRIRMEEKGFTIVPLRLYPNDKNIFKVEIGIGKGRKKKDKREYIKDRESKKEISDALKK